MRLFRGLHMGVSALLLTALAVVLIGCSDDKGAVSSLPTAELQQVMDKKVADSTAVPGAQMAVSRDGESWIGGAGEADTATHAAMNGQLRFRIGSLTKQFTAALILKLAEEGKLSLDDTIRKWLPEIGLQNDEIVTLRMLLNHTSGIPEFTGATFWDDMAFPNPYRFWQPIELVEIAETGQFVTPGTVFSYCNTGYVLAGMIAEKASGQSASLAMAERFFKPLGMSDTQLAVDGTRTDPFAHGYLRLPGSDRIDDVSNWNPSYAWTAGAIVTSSRDMLIWTEALFGGRVLSAASIEAMCTPVAPATQYGLGLGVQQVADGRTFMIHSGKIPGYYAILAHHRTTGLTVFLLTNREDISEETNDVADDLFFDTLALIP